MGKPRVSIGLPVYNGQKFIRKSIDSILNQTFGDFELIISDNASSDETVDIVSEYVNKDKRIRFYPQDNNLGLVKNFNRVFELSSAEYFRWATADDYIGPAHLEKCVKVLDSDPQAVLCYTKTVIVDSDGNNIDRNYEEGLDLNSSKASERYMQLYKNLRLCNAHYGLIRSSVLRKTPLIGDYIGSDVVLFGELALYGKFVEIPEYLFYRRMHEQSSHNIKGSEDLLHEYYHPKKEKVYYMYSWRHLYEKICSVGRVPLSPLEKMKTCKIILKSGVQNRRELGREIYNAITYQVKDYFTHGRRSESG